MFTLFVIKIQGRTFMAQAETIQSALEHIQNATGLDTSDVKDYQEVNMPRWFSETKPTFEIK